MIVNYCVVVVLESQALGHTKASHCPAKQRTHHSMLSVSAKQAVNGSLLVTELSETLQAQQSIDRQDKGTGF